jgi:hypothetical protein
MEGLNIVELGQVSEETRGTMLLGVPDSGGPHYFVFSDHLSVHARPASDRDRAIVPGIETLPRD